MIGTHAWSDALGDWIEAALYLPAGYDDTTRRYPVLYLLHGRGDDLTAWQQVEGDLDGLIAAGRIPPVIAVMPDAPWSDCAGYYVDSRYAGDDRHPAGAPVETAFAVDLVGHVDRAYRTIAGRDARALAGYSMGGAGALRLLTARQTVFSAAIVLGAAVYDPLPPADSSTRSHGAYGVGDRLFVDERYRELSYPSSFAALDPGLPIHLFIGVGDDETAREDPAEAAHDLDYESATLYNRARRIPGITAEFRVIDGPHDWSVWRPLFRAGLLDLAPRLFAV